MAIRDFWVVARELLKVFAMVYLLVCRALQGVAKVFCVIASWLLGGC